MRHLICSTLLFALPLFAQEAAWLTKYEEAKELAKKENKLILADFTGSDWCGWCIKLKEEVFSKPEFATWAKDKVVLLELDFPRKTELPAELKEQNEKLKKEFKISGYPTIVFLDGNGKELGRGGYVAGGPAKWIEQAEKKSGVKSKKPKAAKK